MPDALNRDRILGAFSALDDELGAVGIKGNVFVVGGAAIAVAYDSRRSTVDVDAVFSPAAEVRRAAERVADRLSLSADWLNDGAKGFLPGADHAGPSVYEGPNLQVAAASPRYLLAMKLLASRVERDQDDIRTLYGLCGFKSAREGIELVGASYPEHVIPPRTRFMLEEMFPARRVEAPKRTERPPPGLGLDR